MPAELRGDDGLQHVGQHGRLQSGCIRIYQEKAGIFRQDLRCQAQEGEDAFFYFPDLAFGTPAIGRGIHDDGVVSVAAADLTLHEFDAVVHKPADRRIRQTGSGGVLF